MVSSESLIFVSMDPSSFWIVRTSPVSATLPSGLQMLTTLFLVNNTSGDFAQ